MMTSMSTEREKKDYFWLRVQYEQKYKLREACKYMVHIWKNVLEDKAGKKG